MLFRWCVWWAWALVPRDWCWFALDSLERGIYDAIRRAAIDMDRIVEKRRLNWERIDSLKDQGTKR